MNYYNRHLSDILDTFRTFIRHIYWHFLDDYGDHLAIEISIKGKDSRGTAPNVEIKRYQNDS